jgi:tetratricopeptide (TPR) repeat protein
MSPPAARQRTDGPFERGLTAAAMLFAVAPPLLIGSAHPLVATALTGLTTALVLALLVRGWSGSRPCLRLTYAGAGLAGVCALAAGQLLPLPPDLLNGLSARTLDLWRFVPEGLGLAAPTWRPISLAPVQTSVALTRDLGALALFCTGATFLGREHRLRALLWALAATGAALGLIGVVHRLLHLEAVYGLYALPNGMQPLLVGPFVNQNNLAGYEMLGAGAAVGIAASGTRVRTRVFAAALGLACVATMATTGSRGAVPALGTAAAAFLVLRAVATRGRERIRWIAALAVVLLAGAVFASAVLASVDAATGLPALLNDLKFRPWRDVPHLLAAFPITGIGRGAFVEVYPAFKTILERLTFTHLENEPLELLVEAGPIAGGALLLALVGGGALVAWRLRGGGPMAAGAVAGLVGLGGHNLFDFNLQIAGVLLPAALCAGALAGRAWPLRAERRSGRGWGRRVPSLALAAALVGAVVLGAWASRHTLANEDAELRAAATRGRADLEHAAAAAVNRHPTDSYLLLQVGAALLAGPAPDAREAIRWINRAMYLNPTAAEPHLWAARALYALGLRAQARIEYRLCLNTWLGAGTITPEIVRRYSTLEALLPAVPVDHPDVVDSVAWVLLDVGRVDDSLDLVDVALASTPDDPRLLNRRYEALMHGSRWDEAADAAADMAAVAETPAARAQSLLFEATALNAAGAQDRTATAARAAAAANPADPNPAIVAAQLALDRGHLTEARALVDAALARGDLPAAAAARLKFLLGRIELSSGSATRAALALDEAIRLDPRTPDYRLAAADAYLSIGDRRRAIEEYRALGAMGGSYVLYNEKAAALEHELAFPASLPSVPPP